MARIADKLREGEPELLGATQFLLLLQSVPHLGEKALIRLLAGSAQRRLSAEEILRLPVEALQKDLELDPRSAEYIATHREELVSKSAAIARTLRAYPIQLLSITGAAYPSRLERFSDIPPPLLYALGNTSLLDPTESNSKPSKFTFTVALSRSASAESLARLDDLATRLVMLGGVPVTGHDRAEYQRLALSAQRRNCSTLYVFDRGLREALGPQFDRPPFAAARIRDVSFENQRDLAISPYRLDDHCLGGNNRRRDSLIFALSDLVIALDVRGAGAMYSETLRAFEQGKKVFVARDGRDGCALLAAAGVPVLPPSDELSDFLTRTVSKRME